MNTVQSNVGKGNYANTPPQTDATASKIPYLPDGRTHDDLLQLINSLQDWATNSIAYIKRRNHLSFSEKSQACEVLEGYAYRMRSIIKSFDETGYECVGNTVGKHIDQYLHEQAKLNLYARFYEFPVYRLPDSIPQPVPNDEVFFEVTSDLYRPILLSGDRVRGKVVYSLSELEPNDPLLIIYRHNYRKSRKKAIGWFGGINENDLILRYDNPRLINQQPRRAISMYEVVHIVKAESYSRSVN